MQGKSFFIMLAAMFVGGLAFGQSAETRAQFNGVPAPKLPTLEVRPVRPFEPVFSTALSLNSKYFRDGWCENSSPVAIGQFEVCESGLYLGTRSTFNFSDRAGRGRHFQDVRYYIGCGVPFVNTGHLGPVTVDVCWTYNLYPGKSNDNSGEIAISFQLDEIWQKGPWALTGALSLNHNYGKNECYAVTDATLHYCLRQDGSLMIDNTALLYWGDTRKLRRVTDGQCGGNAFHTAGFRCALPWSFRDDWHLTPFVEVDIHPDTRARKAAQRDSFNSAATVQAGLSLTCQF